MADDNEYEEFLERFRRYEESFREEMGAKEKAMRRRAVREGEIPFEDVVHILTLRVERVNDVLTRTWSDDLKKRFIKNVIPLLEESIAEMKISLEEYDAL